MPSNNFVTKAQTGLLDLTLRFMAGGILILDEQENVVAINDQACELFAIPSASVVAGDTLSEFLTVVGQGVGWDPDRITRVVENHRRWKREGIDRDLDHDFDDGRVVRVGYRPLAREGAVLTYNEVTAARRLERMVQEREAKAEQFRTEIVATVHHMADAAENVSRTSEGAQEASRAAAMHVSDLATAAHQSASSMSSAAQLAASLNIVIANIAQDALRAAEGAGTAAESARRTAELSENLKSHSEAISSILDLIRAIGTQTKLLALNASIEAARAGDAGQGFSVVAQEVKSLAEQTTRAANDVEKKIDGIRIATTEVMEANNAIKRRLTSVEDQAHDIHAQIAQQQINVGAIAGAIDETAAVASQMAESVDNVSRNSESLGRAVREVSDTFGQVSTLIERLEDGSARFLELASA